MFLVRKFIKTPYKFALTRQQIPLQFLRVSIYISIPIRTLSSRKPKTRETKTFLSNVSFTKTLTTFRPSTYKNVSYVKYTVFRTSFLETTCQTIKFWYKMSSSQTSTTLTFTTRICIKTLSTMFLRHRALLTLPSLRPSSPF